ncbi:MAG: InlB B-repeat-containing protein [Bacilli bacterium]|nr:InlB B-repeat-containing protein [Bacilli bacterium]
MQKLTRKTFITIFTIILTFITLGAITFAWFTLTTTAEVEQFDTDIKAESGIEVSLDCETFASYIRKDDIVKKIKTNLNIEEGPIVLNAVTTANGYSNFKTINVDDYSDAPILKEINEKNQGKWIWFNLFFRTPEQGTYIYLLDDTDISSVGKPWKSDARFNDTSSSIINPGEMKMIYACNTLRMSFSTHNIDFEKMESGNEPIGDEIQSVVIYELDPTYDSPPKSSEKNQRLDQTIQRNYGLIEYFRIKNGGTPEDPDAGINLLDYFNNEVLPPNVLKSSNLVNASTLKDQRGVIAGEKAAILEFDDATYHEETGFYYGVVKVQMWIEGWDPDCYNAILMADLQIKLSFGGSKQKPSIDSTAIDAETEFNIEYIWEDYLGTLEHENPLIVKKHELPLFLKPASIKGYVFAGWFLTYEEGELGKEGTYRNPCTYISRSYELGAGEERIKLYAKFREYKIDYNTGIGTGQEDDIFPEEYPTSYSGTDLLNLSIALPILNDLILGENQEAVKYIFLGWYLNPGFKGNIIETIDNSIRAVPGDIILYAKWEEVVEYRIEYIYEKDHEGAEHDNPMVIKTNNLPLELKSASLSGYVFAGWYLKYEDGEYSNLCTQISKGITEDIILYARFRDYNIAYNLGDGDGQVTLPAGCLLNYNGTTPLPIELIPIEDKFVIGEGEGAKAYEFTGWYLNSEFSGVSINEINSDTVGVPGDISLYAKWEEVLEYTVTYDFGVYTDVDNPNPSTVETSELPLLLEPASLDGYVFEGWFIDFEYVTEWISISKGITADVTLYAKFTVAPPEG